MPDFADEHEDLHLAPTDRLDDQADRPGTPLIVRGATTIDTEKLKAMRVRDPGLLIVDAGMGLAVPEHAIWVWANQEQFDSDPSVAAVIATVERSAHGNKATPVVVMGDGPRGSLSYNAALRLVRNGYSQVYWYRGGEQSWAQAGLPAQELRP